MKRRIVPVLVTLLVMVALLVGVVTDFISLDPLVASESDALAVLTNEALAPDGAAVTVDNEMVALDAVENTILYALMGLGVLLVVAYMTMTERRQQNSFKFPMLLTRRVVFHRKFPQPG